jgi:hypothetical protein
MKRIGGVLLAILLLLPLVAVAGVYEINRDWN